NKNSAASGQPPAQPSTNAGPRTQFNSNTQLRPSHDMLYDEGHSQTWYENEDNASAPAATERIPAYAPPNPVVDPYDPSFVSGDVRMLEQGTTYYPPLFGAAQSPGPRSDIYGQNMLFDGELLNRNADKSIYGNGMGDAIPDERID